MFAILTILPLHIYAGEDMVCVFKIINVGEVELKMSVDNDPGYYTCHFENQGQSARSQYMVHSSLKPTQSKILKCVVKQPYMYYTELNYSRIDGKDTVSGYGQILKFNKPDQVTDIRIWSQ